MTICFCCNIPHIARSCQACCRGRCAFAVEGLCLETRTKVTKVRGSSDSAKGRAHAREGRRDCRLQGLCTGISHRPGLYVSVGVQHSRSKLLSSFTQLPSTTPCCSLPPSGLKWRVCACVLRYPTHQIRTKGVKCRDFLIC